VAVTTLPPARRLHRARRLTDDEGLAWAINPSDAREEG